MTSAAVRAATRLLRWVQDYLSFDPSDLTGKFVPVEFADSGESSGKRQPSVAAAFTAQQFLDHVPFILGCTSAPRCSTAVEARAAGDYSSFAPYSENVGDEDEEDVRHVMRFLAEVVSAHLRQYDAAVGAGASTRAAWLAWTILYLFRCFASDAATDTPEWVRGDYEMRLQTIRRAWKLAASEEEVAPLAPSSSSTTPSSSDQSFIQLFREMARAMAEHEEAAGPDLFGSANSQPFSHFFNDVVCPLFGKEPTDASSDDDEVLIGGEGTVRSAAEALFPLHPLSPGFAARQMAVASLTSFCPNGVAALVKDVQTHLAAHESAAQRRWGEGAATHRSPAPQDRAPCRDWGTGRGVAACAFRDAIRHGFGLVKDSIQLLPTSLDAEGEVLGGGGIDDGSDRAPAAAAAGSPPGAWLVGGTRHHHQEPHHQRVRLILPPRLCLLLPGLAIAGTEITTECGVSMSGAGGPLPSSGPDSLSPTSTLLVSPPLARLALLWQPPLPIPAAMQEQGGGDGIQGQAVTLPPSSLCPVTALYLFTSLPPLEDVVTAEDGLTAWWALLEAAVRRVGVGRVLLIVQAAVSKEALRRVEGWADPTRAVVVVGSVGEWGLTQLALRFDCTPNFAPSMADDASQVNLFPVRAVVRPGVGMRLVQLDEVSKPREYTSGSGGGGGKPSSCPFTETRRRFVLVVGEYEPATACPPVSSTCMRPNPDGASTTSESSSSETDSEGEEEWTCPMPSRISPLPYVRCCVLVGGVTPPQQAERIVVFHRVLEALLHRCLLPARLRRALAATPACELAVVARMDAALRTGEPTAAPGHNSGFYRRAAQALRDATWQYLLRCEMRRRGGGPVESAWAYLQEQQLREEGSCDVAAAAARERDDAMDRGAYRETHLQVRAAYLTAGRALDELCSTALLLGSRRRGESSGGGGEANFVPIIR